jgi:hypothetical protein
MVYKPGLVRWRLRWLAVCREIGASSSRDTGNVTFGRTFSRAHGNGRRDGDQASRVWGARRSHGSRPRERWG